MGVCRRIIVYITVNENTSSFVGWRFQKAQGPICIRREIELVVAVMIGAGWRSMRKRTHTVNQLLRIKIMDSFDVEVNMEPKNTSVP